MKEIRFHGRGGQGAVTAADLLAMAAFFDGKYSQAFPSFGTERRGAPVTAFARISDRFIRLRSQIYEPDYIVVQDPSLLEVIDVAAGLKSTGKALINTEKSEIKLNTEAEVHTINATRIALDVLGVPIVNTAMIGAFAALTGEVSLESVIKAVRRRFPEKLAERNVRAVEVAYEEMEAKL
ncbi:MAG: pyruvate ferredoxin oxidoreductase subunit gamma [Euryarchaeota archaeon]|nr:pyruvate ferredoxin oxidoreductase subunit gamma [Euryarchaeota archaeon]